VGRFRGRQPHLVVEGQSSLCRPDMGAIRVTIPRRGGQRVRSRNQRVPSRPSTGRSPSMIRSAAVLRGSSVSPSRRSSQRNVVLRPRQVPPASRRAPIVRRSEPHNRLRTRVGNCQYDWLVASTQRRPAPNRNLVAMEAGASELGLGTSPSDPTARRRRRGEQAFLSRRCKGVPSSNVRQ